MRTRIVTKIASFFIVASLASGLAGAAENDLVWSTFLGGGGAEYGHDIAVDSSGDVWLTGFTGSEDFPAFSGARRYAGEDRDIFIARLDPAGTALLFSTILGDSLWEEGFSLASGEDGSIYVTGYSQSQNFPVTAGALDTSLGGAGDAVVLKLGQESGHLIYATFLGGSAEEQGYAVAVDGSGRAFVAGISNSADFPFSPGAFDHTLGGEMDAFAACLDPTGATLGYATFLGGSDLEYGWGIALDDSGCAYLTGYTFSSDFPTTAGAFDNTLTGLSDCFVARLSPSGETLRYATLLGGGLRDAARSVAVDEEGRASITGYTFSQDFPLTAGAPDSTVSFFDADAFLTQLDRQGSSLIFSSFLGGQGNDSGYGVVMGDPGIAWVIGFTDAEDFPCTAGAFDGTPNGERDVFLTVLNTEESRLEYSTLIGGHEDDYGWDLVLGREGYAYLTGYTRSAQFPTTPGAFEQVHGGGEDVFILKLRPGGFVPVGEEPFRQPLPRTCRLKQNYPNPFNASTQIPYRLAAAGPVNMRIYNALGQEVRCFDFGEVSAGDHEVLWDGRDDEGSPLASGAYFCRLDGDGRCRVIKMMLMR